MKPNYDVIVLGAGAAGMMCAGAAGQGGRSSVLVLDHARSPGEKIRISVAGAATSPISMQDPANYISNNRHSRNPRWRATPEGFHRSGRYLSHPVA